MVDLDAIRAWVDEQRGDEYCRDVVTAIEYIDALLAEVERLRGVIDPQYAYQAFVAAVRSCSHDLIGEFYDRALGPKHAKRPFCEKFDVILDAVTLKPFEWQGQTYRHTGHAISEKKR